MIRGIFLFLLPLLLFLAGCEIPIGTPQERMVKSAKNNYVSNMRRMLDSGIDPNITDGAGWTPLMWAAAKDNTDIIKLLMARGGKIEARNKKGETPLHIASRWSRLETVKFLISVGARTEALDRLGWPPMMWAAMQGRTEVIQALAEGGANIEFRDTNGNTPLIMAANRGRDEAIKALLQLGANPFKTNKDGQTAADVAELSGYKDLSALLRGEEPARRPVQKRRR